MNCPEVMEQMNRFLDDDLDEAELNHLMGHLGQCADCSDMFERLQRISAELDQLPKVEPPCSIVDTIMPKLHQIDLEQQAAELVKQAEQPAKAIVPFQRRFLDRFPLRTIGGVVAAGILIGLFITTFRPEPAQHAELSYSTSADQATEEKAVSTMDSANTTTEAPEGSEAKPESAVTPSPPVAGQPQENAKIAPVSPQAADEAPAPPKKDTAGVKRTTAVQQPNQQQASSGAKLDMKQEMNQDTKQDESQHSQAATTTPEGASDPSAQIQLFTGQHPAIDAQGSDQAVMDSSAANSETMGKRAQAISEMNTMDAAAQLTIHTQDHSYRAVFHAHTLTVYDAAGTVVHTQQLEKGLVVNPAWSEEGDLTFGFAAQKEDGTYTEQVEITVHVASNAANQSDPIHATEQQ